jgi:hypothetical protein
MITEPSWIVTLLRPLSISTSASSSALAIPTGKSISADSARMEMICLAGMALSFCIDERTNGSFRD